MKKVVSMLILLLCAGLVFAINIKPYLVTLDLHPLVLKGFCPTYAGVGVDFNNPGNKLHGKISLAGGVYERNLFQNPYSGCYISKDNKPVQPVDLFNLEWEVKGEIHGSEFLTLTAGYWGIFEKRSVWKQNFTTERWLGGEKKQVLKTDLDKWVDELGGNIVFPELGTDKSIYHALKAEIEYNRMFDNMVANDGYIIKANMVFAPKLVNKQANFASATLDFIYAKNVFDYRFADGRCKFALSLIDRVDFNIIKGSVPAYFQESTSLGRRVRGFDTGSYANTISVVNNFEVRLSGPAIRDNIFLRTDLFYDLGFGFGKIANTDIFSPNVLASIGIQEMIDYNDAFDLGVEVAYLLHGSRMSNPTNPLQVGATFFLDF